VTNIDTGAVVSGAEIVLSGSTNTTLQSDLTGSYRVVMTPGAVNITITATGYQFAVVAITTTAGQIIDFSPGLIPENSNNNDPAVTVSGTVVDADTNAPIAGALIVVDSTKSHQATSDASGDFTIMGIEAGQLSLTVSGTGYNATTATMLATPSSSLEIGSVYLQPRMPATESAVSGRVTDSSSGLPIMGSVISIEGGVQTAITDAKGYYQIDQINQPDFSILASATGYLSGFVNVSMTEPKLTTVNFTLTPSSVGGISIDAFSTDSMTYDAYQNAEVSLSIKNGSAYSQTIIPLIELYDENNQLIRQLALSDSNVTGGPNTSYNLLQDSVLNVSAIWYTGQMSPGNYKIHSKVLDKYTGQILAEKIIVRTIEPTQNIEKMTLRASPQFGTLSEIVQIEFKVDVANKSNTAGEVVFTYELSSPSGAPVKSDNVILQVSANDVTKTFTLDSLQHTFAESGKYSLSLQIIGGIQPEQIEVVPISVSPSTRVEAEQSVAPTKVTPDGDKRITVGVKLKGVEAK
jgi:hypothetical protein